VAYSNYERILSIPLHPSLTDDDVDDVTAAVLDIVRAHRR
jgi:dTDP-4-amino-4,6-dideoxygalactose transaminase